MFKYNNTHIFTGYLKQLLSSVNLPTCKIYTSEFAEYLKLHGKEDPRILESFDTIQNNNGSTRLAVRINYLKNNEPYVYFSNNPLLLRNNNTGDILRNKSQFDWKKSTNAFYELNRPIFGLTKTLSSPGGYYDTVTHEYLGEYLRFLRDYYNINLMSLYNCFNNKICNNILYKHKIKVLNPQADNKNNRYTEAYREFNSQDSAYKIYAVPVKLFADYTIAIDCDQGIEMFCGFYRTLLDISAKSEHLAAKTYIKVNKTIFSQPFLYDKLSVKNWPIEYDYDFNLENNTYVPRLNSDLPSDTYTRWEIANREQDLKLIIKVPASCNSSIVILEGDYRSYNDAKYAPNRSGLECTYDNVGLTTWRYDDEIKTVRADTGNDEVVLGLVGDAPQIKVYKITEDDKEVSSRAQFIKDEQATWIKIDSNIIITNAVAPADNPSSKLAFCYNNKIYYFAGTGSITDDYRYGVPVTFEATTNNEYYISYIENGKKSYLNLSYASMLYQNNSSIINFGNKFDNFDRNAYGFKPISKLQLLAFNTGESYPFADRLVEYLSGSAITPIDEIADNIKRVQRVMSQNNNYFSIEGLWENKMQKLLYDSVMNSGPILVATYQNADGTTNNELVDKRLGIHPRLGKTSKSSLYDVLGYVDKDAEKLYASWKIDSASNKTGEHKKGTAVVKDSIQNIDIYDGLYDI